MINKHLSKFNIACLALIFVCGLGMVWYARGFVRELLQEEKAVLDIPTVDRSQFETATPGATLDTEENNATTQADSNRTIQQLNNETSAEEAQEETIKKDPDAPFDPSSKETTPSQGGTLPAKMNLAVPFTSQAPEYKWGEQPWEDACEEATVLMVDAYYKGYKLSSLFARDEILKIVAWEKERGWGTSIPLVQMGEVFNFLFPDKGYRIIENPTIDDIKKAIVAGNPVIVPADGKVLPNPYFRNGGPVYHALLIRGYTETTFITNDPGTWRGENFEYTYEDLMNSIRDWNDGDVKSAKRVVLVPQ